MRLDPTEFPFIPLPAAMFAHDGTLLAATPEWKGMRPGSISYLTGFGHIVVSGEEVSTDLDSLMSRLLAAIRASIWAMDTLSALRASVLAASLELVAGRPIAKEDVGTSDEALIAAQSAIEARVNGIQVLTVPLTPPVDVRAPALVALAMTQFAVNANKHESATQVRLRVAPGPSFFVEWASMDAASADIDSSRHHDRRGGWGWGFIQLAADALGATAIPPGPLGRGIKGACFSLGAPRIALPLAYVADGIVRRCTTSWDQDRRLPSFGAPANALVEKAVAAAVAKPGEIVDIDIYRARQIGEATWICLPPEAGLERIRDVLHGLSHERTLFRAPAPHNTIVDALVDLVGIAALDQPWPHVPLSIWTSGFEASRAALGLPVQPEIDCMVFPDPRITAYLLSTLDGKLLQRGENVFVAVGQTRRADPLCRLLHMDEEGLIHVNPGLSA